MRYLPALLILSSFVINLRAQTPARECPTGTITAGSTVSSALEATDCKVSELIANSTNSSLGKRFQLDAAAKAIYTFTVAATGYAPALAVFTAQGRLVGSNVAAIGGTARLTANLPAGSYTVLTYGSAPGAFELKAASEAPRTCATEELPEAGSFDGAFSASSCRVLDLTELSTSTVNVAFFRYQVSRRGVVVMESDTAIARLNLTVITPSLTTFGGLKQLTVSLLAGAHVVSVTSTELGSYTLKTRIEEPRACTATAVDMGSETAGKLESGGCRWLDFFMPSSDPTPVNLYRFSVDQRTVTQIDQTSATVDSFFVLLSATAVLASNDDASSGTSDSRVLIHLIPGTYIAVASAYDATTLGDFTLKLAGTAPKTCDAVPLTPGVATDGQVPAEGCRVLDYVGLSTVTDLVAPFKFEATDPAMVGLRLEGATSSTMRALSTEGVEFIRQAADRNGALGMEVRVPAVPVTVLVTSTAAAKPAFKLTAQTRAIPDCASTPLDLNGQVEGTLTGNECKFNELVNLVPVNSPTLMFTVQLPEKGRHVLELESTGFAPALAVASAKNELNGLTYAVAPGRISLNNPQAQPGDYRILVTSATAAGAGTFKLGSSFEPAVTPPASAKVGRYAASQAPDTFTFEKPVK